MVSIVNLRPHLEIRVKQSGWNHLRYVGNLRAWSVSGVYQDSVVGSNNQVISVISPRYSDRVLTGSSTPDDVYASLSASSPEPGPSHPSL